MKIKKEQFKKLAKKHLVALEGYDINKTIEIFGVGRLYDEVIKIEQQNNKMKRDMKEEIRDYKLVRWYPSLPIKWDSTHSYQYNRKLNVMVNITLRDKKIVPYVQSMPLIEPDFIEYWEKNKPKPEFKTGDILVNDLGPASSGDISIFKCISKENNNLFDIYASLDGYGDSAVKFNLVKWDFIEDQRLATEEEKQMLFNALKKEGKRWNAETLEVEKLDISEIVVDYESAIKYLGIKDTLLVFKNYDRVDKFNAQIKLQLIAEAWNKFDEFKVDWESLDQYKHHPIFVFEVEVEDGKFEFSHTSSIRMALDFHTSNFSFKTEERAKQFGEQFIDLFKVALGF